MNLPDGVSQNLNSEIEALLLRTHTRLAAGDAPGALHALLEALQRIGASGGAIEAVARHVPDLVIMYSIMFGDSQLTPPPHPPLSPAHPSASLRRSLCTVLLSTGTGSALGGHISAH